MKNLVIAIVAVVILGAGWFYFSAENLPNDSLNTATQLTDVNSVDLETQADYPFSIENVFVDTDTLVLSDGTDSVNQYQISWDYESGTNGDPANAYITATIVDENDIQVMWLKGVGVSEYKKEADTFSLGTLCSVLPSEGCMEDENYSSEMDYRVKIQGANCSDSEVNPGYCSESNREPIEPAYSNWFKLSVE